MLRASSTSRLTGVLLAKYNGRLEEGFIKLKAPSTGAPMVLKADLGKIDVFGFVIMPNHIHLIWRILELNGKEKPQGSLLNSLHTSLRTSD